MSRTPADAPVVVGVESTDAGRLALSWAADEATLRRRPLRLLRAADWPLNADESLAPKAPWETWRDRYRDACRRVLHEARTAALARHPGLEVDARLVDGAAERVLADASEGASLIVLGSRRLSTLREAFTTGSIAVPVIAHASCPVAVVRYPEHAEAVPPTVVAGVDGSRDADRGLAYAFEEAAMRGATVLAVHAYAIPVGLGITAMITDAAVREAQETVEHALDAARARFPEVPATGEVRIGHPVQLLTEASKDALSLVVGSRGIGGFRRMLLGSVSHGLVHHARCPLIVVPSGPDDA